MTPSQITANQQAISNYTYSVSSAFADYLALYTTRVKLVGRASLKDMELKVKLLAAFVDIAFDYMSPTMEGDTNFFTEEEFRDIQQHINNLAGTNYYLELQ